MMNGTRRGGGWRRARGFEEDKKGVIIRPGPIGIVMKPTRGCRIWHDKYLKKKNYHSCGHVISIVVENKLCDTDTKFIFMFSFSAYIRDAIFYGLSVVITENCRNFQFSTDYGKLEFFYGNFLKK